MAASWLAEETGQIKSGVGTFLVKELRKRSRYVVRAQFPTRGDKAVRAQSIRGRISMDFAFCAYSCTLVSGVAQEVLSGFVVKVVMRMSEEVGLQLFEDLKQIAAACYRCDFPSRPNQLN